MTDTPAAPDLIAITAKRLDSDETIETVAKIEAPSSELALRKQLTDLVAPLYPGAEFRSFANGAATYLGSKLLVVAVYRPSDGAAKTVPGGDDEQQQLFAA